MVPVGGEIQDIRMLFGSDSTVLERTLAGGSLFLSIVTAGTSPNAASALRGVDSVAYEVRYVDDLDGLVDGTAGIQESVRYVDSFRDVVARSKVPTAELNPTHRIKVRYGSAKTEYEALKADIRANGIKEPIKYIEHGGKKYIVDGHHRLRAAEELGIKDVPAQRVELPYGGYKTPDDLLDFFNNPG